MKNSESDKKFPIIGEKFKVLDKGFVRLVDYMGSDESIVQAARVSYGKGTKKMFEDEALIRYLFRNGHTSPFEMVEFKFHIKLPIFVARQWIRHRTASVNEYSGRYSIMKDDFFVPQLSELRKQSKKNKQSRNEEEISVETKTEFLDYMNVSQENVYSEYSSFVDKGLARELARINLPLTIYTEWYWKMDLHNLFHFLFLRTSPHAQKEIREYSYIIEDIVKSICPISFKAYQDYKKNAISFSAPEIKMLSNLLNFESVENLNSHETNISERELNELKLKLNLIRENI